MVVVVSVVSVSWNQSPVDTEGQLKFWGSEKLFTDFWLYMGVGAPHRVLCKGQLYVFFLSQPRVASWLLLF